MAPINNEEVDLLFRALDLVGVFGNALIGGAMARQKELDPVGFATLAVLSGLGGGIIRDTLLQQGPPAALRDYSYLFTALAGALVSYLIRMEGHAWKGWLWPVIDAVALGCWATTGAQKTLGSGLGWLAAIILGMVTAVGGGATRDVIVRRVPTILGGNTLYASAAAAAATAYVVASRQVATPLAQLVSLAVGTTLCLVARWRGWMLPDADAWNEATVQRLKTYVGTPRHDHQTAPHPGHEDFTDQD